MVDAYEVLDDIPKGNLSREKTKLREVHMHALLGSRA